MTFNDPKHYATSRATNILPLIICILFILTIFFIVLWSYLLCVYHHQSRIQHQKNFPPQLWYNWLIPSGGFSMHCLIDFFLYLFHVFFHFCLLSAGFFVYTAFHTLLFFVIFLRTYSDIDFYHTLFFMFSSSDNTLY